MATPVPDDLLELIVDGAWVPADAPTIQEEGGNATTREEAGNATTREDAGNATTREEAGNVTTLRFSEGPTLRYAVSSLDLASLRAKALELEATPDEGVTRSNVGGFHGHTDAFELAECAAARAFLEAAAPEAAAARPAKRARFDVEVEGARLVVDGGGGAYALTVGVEDGVLSLDAAARAGDADRGGGGVEAWFNVSRAGHFNALHDHRGAGVSGVLWIAAPPAPPDLEHSGALFVALRGPDGRRPGVYAVLRPSEGAAVLFDADLPHAVLPVAPDALRGPDDARVSLSFNFPA